MELQIVQWFTKKNLETVFILLVIPIVSSIEELFYSHNILLVNFHYFCIFRVYKNEFHPFNPEKLLYTS